MAKHRKPNKQAFPIIVTFGIVLAVLIGIAYLANNTIGSQAASLYIMPQTSLSNGHNSSSASSDNNGSILPPKISPKPACQSLLDEVWTKISTDRIYQTLLARLAWLQTQPNSPFKTAQIAIVKMQLSVRLALFMSRYVACLNDTQTSTSSNSNSIPHTVVPLTQTYRTRY